METRHEEAARRWLADQGVSRTAGGWVRDGEPDVLFTAGQVAHSWAGDVFAEDMDAADRVRLAFGLLDLLDTYWVTCEIRFAYEDPEDPLPAGALWDGYRRRLEADRDAETVTYSLWVDWFEDRATSATAFAEVLGNDIDRTAAEPSEALIRRARRVLECSGPVDWTVKEPAYRTAVRLPDLHEPVFRGLLASFHDLYGDLDPTPARALLDRLDLPPHTRHLPELRHALAAGHRNHHRSPGAWDDAVRSCSRP
ncbi:hypothetical protein ACIQRS_14235 [Streptomyces termitum]|uniref:Uncharacterized protein n=1 Tax=Streptomyces termitum TaxID=67368 RepID=A0A918T8E3_9ACTN|nr:hypothetical protein [Streptomyces termitum]GHB11351.1 hypothetical protein GCM10010305_62550 [Streptomyces termitum]